MPKNPNEAHARIQRARAALLILVGVIVGACMLLGAVVWILATAPDERVRVRLDVERRALVRLHPPKRLVTARDASGLLARVIAEREHDGPRERGVLALLALDVWRGAGWGQEATVRHYTEGRAREIRRVRERLAAQLRLAGIARECGERDCTIAGTAYLARAAAENALTVPELARDGLSLSGEVRRVHARLGVPTVELATPGRRWRVLAELEAADGVQAQAARGLRRGAGIVLVCLAARVERGDVIASGCRLVTDEMSRDAAHARLVSAYAGILAGFNAELSAAALDALASGVLDALGIGRG